MISNVATDPATGRQVIVANFESFRKKLEENIDKACNDFLAEPDWNKNFEIYDALNRTAYLCPFAVAALRRKLKTKEPEIEILALHLLEGMIKNVPSSHGAVAQPSFMRYLVKVALDTRKQGMMKSIGKKFKKDAASNSTHLRAQTIDKALIIIQMLKNAYENSNTYPIFVDTYKQLKKQGVKFPVLTKDETDQVFEPMHSNKWANYGKKGSKAPSAMGSVGQIGNSVVANHANIDRSLPMIRPVKLIEKVVDNELKTAQENAVFFFEMVNSSDPGENLNSNDLIQQLHTSVSEWQARVVMKISDPNCNPMIMDQGFQINDMMNNLMTDYQGLLIGTKRRYEEGLDIKNLSKKKKGGGGDDDDDSNDDSEDDSSNKNKGDEKDDDSDDDKNKKHNKNKSKDIDPFIPPPPADEGNHSNHARRQSKRQSQLGKKRQSQIKKHQKQDTGDLLDMFGDNNNNNNTNNSSNNNNNKNNPPIIGKAPSLQPEQSAINIFDIMGSIPSGPIPPSKTVGNNNMNSMNSMTNNGIMNSSQMNNSNNGNVKIGEASISPPNTSSNGSGNNNNNNNNNSSGFDALGDPFSGNAKSNNNNGNDFMGSADNPFDLMGGGGGGNANANANVNANRNMNVNNGNLNGNSNVAAVNNSNGSDNPFAGLNDDPFAGISSGGGGGVSSNVAPANNNKAKNDFMGGDDNPFAFMGGSNNASNNNNNNNNMNKNQNNNAPKDDFLGGSNPFAFVD